MAYWTVTNVKTAKGLAALMRRHFSEVKQVGTSVVCYAENKPWAILAGYMTNNTQVIPSQSIESAIEKARQ